MESGTDVVGRDEEVAALADFLDARTRLPAVLLLEGEAGIGKTTLWRRGVELAAEPATACCRARARVRRLSSRSWLSVTSWRTRSERCCRRFRPPRPRVSLSRNDSPADTAQIRTNRAGNGRADVFFVPADVAGFEGVHGVLWTVQNAGGEVVYRTGCTTVTLD